ncbi:MAG TPA: energy transducer TonB [Gammaproteobacteria bacterium]|nr:energy transducer TonB [Gammaproteobacteria bacterium]
MLFGVLLVAIAGAQAPPPAPTPPSAPASAPASNGGNAAYVPAEVESRTPPDYPARALRQGREGWARVSFIISEEGRVIEPMIEDSSSPDFDEPTLRAIESWLYKPATLGGKPVEQSMVQTIIRYQLRSGEKGAKPKFVSKYRAAYSSVVAKQLVEAAPLIQELEQGEMNFYEDAWLGWLKYVYLEATGTATPEALEQALSRALGSSGSADDDYLEPAVYVSGWQRLFVIRARNGDLSGAVTAFERLKASKAAHRSKSYEEVVASLEPSYREIMSLVEGPTILQQKARVEEHDYWVHHMLRRSFAIGDVQDGKLHVVDVRCTRTNRRFVSLPPESVLTIPDSWGDCSVYIKGDVGTTFAFEEYPADFSKAAAAGQTAPPLAQ